MSDIKTKIREAKDIDTIPYPVEEWDVTLELRAFTVGERGIYLEKMQSYRDDDGNLRRGYIAAMQPALLVSSCFDPETSEPIFDDTDEEWLIEKSGDVVDGIVTKILKMNGLMAELDSDETVVDAGKDDSSKIVD